MSTVAWCASAALVFLAIQSKPTSAPASSRAWLVCTGSVERPGGSIARFDLQSGAVDKVFDVRSGVGGEHEPVELALLPDGASVLVAQVVGAGTHHAGTFVETVSLADGGVSASARFDGWLDSLEFHPASGALWGSHIDHAGERRLVRVDLAKAELERVGALPSDLSPRSLAFDKNGKRLWCLSATNVAATDEVVELDPADGKVLRRVRWGFDIPAHAMDIDASGRLIVLAWGGAALEFDPRSGAAKPLFVLADPRLAVPTGLEIERPAPKRSK